MIKVLKTSSISLCKSAFYAKSWRRTSASGRSADTFPQLGVPYFTFPTSCVCVYLIIPGVLFILRCAKHDLRYLTILCNRCLRINEPDDPSFHSRAADTVFQYNVDGVPNSSSRSAAALCPFQALVTLLLSSTSALMLQNGVVHRNFPHPRLVVFSSCSHVRRLLNVQPMVNPHS